MLRIVYDNPEKRSTVYRAFSLAAIGFTFDFITIIIALFSHISFFNVRIALIISTVIQLLSVQIWSMIKLNLKTRLEMALRVIAITFSIVLLGYADLFLNNTYLYLKALLVLSWVIVNILLYISTYGTISEIQQKNELDVMSRQLEGINENKQQIDESYKAYDLFLEDYRKRILAITSSSYIQTTMREELEGIEKNLVTLRPTQFCSHIVINAILNYAQKKCLDEMIDFSTDITLPRDIEIDDADLCSIFNNLINNALNANRFVEKEKYISVSCKPVGNYINITVDNSYNPYHKRDKRRGYGIEILKDLSQKYNGNYKAHTSDKKYIATVIIRYKNEL